MVEDPKVASRLSSFLHEQRKKFKAVGMRYPLSEQDFTDIGALAFMSAKQAPSDYVSAE